MPFWPVAVAICHALWASNMALATAMATAMAMAFWPMVAIAIGHGFWPWAEAMAMCHAPPWPRASANGHNPWPLAHGHGTGPWPMARVPGHVRWPWSMADELVKRKLKLDLLSRVLVKLKIILKLKVEHATLVHARQMRPCNEYRNSECFRSCNQTPIDEDAAGSGGHANRGIRGINPPAIPTTNPGPKIRSAPAKKHTQKTHKKTYMFFICFFCVCLKNMCFLKQI